MPKDDIVSSMKKAMKEHSKLVKPKTSFNPVMKPTHRERDMRQEAIDMGSHGAKEFFGSDSDTSDQ